MSEPTHDGGETPASIALKGLLRLFQLVQARDMRVLGEFAATGDVLLVGSDEGEISIGRPAIDAFFPKLFARDATFSWNAGRVEATRSGDVLWLFADGHICVDGQGGKKTAPYRISGILRRSGERWLWSQYHGSEPVRAP